LNLFRIPVLLPARFLLRFFLKHPHFFGVPFRRCRLEPEAVYETARTSITEYVATLPPSIRDLLAHATEEFYPESFLYELLKQKNAKILVASDGGHKDDYGSFGWVIGTKDEVIWDCEGVARLLHAVLPS
jgi:hypothetical protein